MRESKASDFRWPYVFAVCIPLLALVVFLVTRELDAPATFVPVVEDAAAVFDVLEETREPEKPVAPEVETIPDVGQVLADEFVARDDWRKSNLKEFQETWGRLPAGDRIVAKGAVWFAPLVAGLTATICQRIAPIVSGLLRQPTCAGRLSSSTRVAS